MAASSCSGEQSGACSCTSPVDGLMTPKVFPEATLSPPMVIAKSVMPGLPGSSRRPLSLIASFRVDFPRLAPECDPKLGLAVLRKVLIANRGEIARRIRRTCSALGIKTVAVYTATERDAPFVGESDEALMLDGAGPAPYLDVAGLLDAAGRTGADAIHP